MTEQFCLRWNNHQSTLVAVFENLLESETLTDCTLAAEGRYLKAHKVVLSACSPYFESLLCQHYDKHPIVVLKDVKFYELKAMLDYMYRGEVNISQDQLDTFIKTAESLQIKGLTDQGGGSGSGDVDSDERDVGSTPPPKRKHPPGKTPDLAPESPLVGNAPLREEGPSSPLHKRRRRGRQGGSGGGGDAPDTHLDTSSNSCDMPSPANIPSVSAAVTPSAPVMPVPHADSARLIVRKTEPPDLVMPKTEMIEDHHEDIEDLTLDDDEDYRNEAPKPGTSHSGGPIGQDYSQWQMSGDRSADEVFMAAQEAINNQSNSQGAAESYVCLLCGKTYMHKSTLRRHMRFECGKEPGFHCTACPYKTKHKSSLTLHAKNMHAPKKTRFKCPSCPFATSTELKLQMHELSKHKLLDCEKDPLRLD